MSVYKEPIAWVRQSINSILNQTFEDFEFIIVNDNPNSDDLKELLRSYANQDSRIRIIENSENQGLTKSLNIGISEATGDYIARMDADDISLPNRFQVQYDFMRSHQDVDVCGSFALGFGNVHKFSSKCIKVPITNDQIKLCALFHSPMIHPSVMFKTERLSKKLYNEDFKKAQDYVLWGELIKQGYVLYNIPEYLLKYRITKKSGTNTYRQQQYLAADTIRGNLLKKIIPFIDDRSIDLHNTICNEQKCDLNEAEEWLQKLKESLINQEISPSIDVESIISRLWININLINENTLSNYHKSKLTKDISFVDILRFFKHRMCKLVIFNKIIGGGKLILYFFCYLIYYGFAQYLPSNYSFAGIIFKKVRYHLVKHIFSSCGNNVDINRRANFGNGRNVSIGNNSGIGSNCHVPNNITIGSNVMMAPNCCILGNINHRFERIDIPMREQGIKYTNKTIIGNDVWIGQNVLITPGRTIKDGCILAAGTVLTKDFPEYSIIGGNPSKLIRSRR